MRIELLYFDGCPSYEALLPELRDLIAAEGIDVAVELCRIDGKDVEPGAAEREDFGLECRLYRTAAGLQPVPPAAN